jgi:hypothetical protein
VTVRELAFIGSLIGVLCILVSMRMHSRLDTEEDRRRAWQLRMAQRAFEQEMRKRGGA